MPNFGETNPIGDWLEEVRCRFSRVAPELLSLFDTYAAEAQFGRRYIDSELDRLHPRAQILELGAGSLLLSCQLVREGFSVTALEPTGEGFSHFDRMRLIVLDEARVQGCQPTVLNQSAESLALESAFDFAFSVNVMEHVHDVAGVLQNVCYALIVGARYRFTCPNYMFPYEPHFNIPTLVSKQLTEKVMRRRIFESVHLSDPAGVWTSLNWINVPKISRAVGKIPVARLQFHREIVSDTLERVVNDEQFAARRSPWIRHLLAYAVSYGFHRMPALLPACMLPIIDCSVERSRA